MLWNRVAIQRKDYTHEGVKYQRGSSSSRRVFCGYLSFYRISANEYSNAPRLGVGVAPTSLATHAPTRFATSFIKLREPPCRYSCTSPAVKASPDPTVS